jgi:hypothetical protein
MPNPVVHFEILGKDQPLLEAFYKSIFDWQITPIQKDYSLVNTGSGIGGGIGAMGNDRAHSMFYVAVADVEAALVAVESHSRRRHHCRLPRSRRPPDRPGAGAGGDVKYLH